MSKKHLIALIPGDGIGKEVINATRKIISFFSQKYKFTELKAGYDHFLQTKTALPQETIQEIKKSSGAIFGAVSSPSHKVKGYSSPIVQLRKELDLYGNLRPIKNKGIDLLVVRENTECLYVKREKEENGVAIAERVITEKASRRIGKLAIKELEKRKSLNKELKLTIVHKANVLSITDGLFRESVLDECKKAHFEFKVEEQLIDSMVYKLYKQPQDYNVIVAPNMYGDILSDAGAALVGSLGLVPGANVSDEFVMAEPVHGSAPDIVGKDLANPIACIRSGCMLLRSFNELEDAALIESAVDEFIEKYSSELTPDLGGGGSTSGVTDGILKLMERKANLIK